MAVADDQLALAAADRDQRVDGLDAGLHRFIHRAARNDARGFHIDAAALGEAFDGAFAVDRVTQRIDDAPEQCLADRNVDDGAGPLDGIAFFDGDIRAEDHDADIVGFEVKRHAFDAARELDHLAGLHVVEAIDARNAVADGQNLSDFADFRFGAEILNLPLQDRGDFGRLDIHLYCSFTRIFYPGAGFNCLSSRRAGHSAWCAARNRSCANPL